MNHQHLATVFFSFNARERNIYIQKRREMAEEAGEVEAANLPPPPEPKAVQYCKGV